MPFFYPTVYLEGDLEAKPDACCCPPFCSWKGCCPRACRCPWYVCPSGCPYAAAGFLRAGMREIRQWARSVWRSFKALRSEPGAILAGCGRSVWVGLVACATCLHLAFFVRKGHVGLVLDVDLEVPTPPSPNRAGSRKTRMSVAPKRGGPGARRSVLVR